MTTMVYREGKMKIIDGVSVDYLITDDVKAAKKGGWKTHAEMFKAKTKRKTKAAD